MRILILAVLIAPLPLNTAVAWDSGDPGFIHLDFGFETEYDDNLFFVPNNQEEDWIVTGSFGVDAGYKTEKLEFHLNPAWRYYKFEDNEDLDDNDQFYRARLDYRFSPRFRINTQGAFIIDNRREDQVTDTGVVFENVQRERWDTALSAEYLLSTRSAITLFGQYENDDYQENRISTGFNDLEAYGVGLGYNHRLHVYRRPVSLLLNTAYFYYDYDTAETQYAYLTTGAAIELNEKFTLSAEAGPRHTNSEYDAVRRVPIPGTPLTQILTSTEEESKWGANGLLNLAYDGKKTNWELALSHEIRAPSGQTQAVRQTLLQLNLNQRLTWNWSTHLLAQFYHKESNRDDSDAGDVDEDTLVLQPRVRYRINNDWFVQGLYRYSWREDDDIDESWDRNQARLQVGYNWKIWE